MGSAAFAWTQVYGSNSLSVLMTDPLLPGMELTLEQSAFQAPSVQVLHDRAIAQGQISNQQWTIVVGIFLIVLFALVVTLIASIRLMRSEEHTSELQSLMRTSYAVFCLK